MKIKAIMLGLVVCGAFAQSYPDEVRQREIQVDNLTIDTTNPQYLKELTKSMIRIDYVSQKNMKSIVELSGFIAGMNQEVNALRKEVSRLKQQLKNAKR